MPGSLSIETEVRQVSTSPLETACTVLDVQSSNHEEEVPTFVTHIRPDLEEVQLVSPLVKAIETVGSCLGDDEMSSTDTAVSSPIFDSCSVKGSSAGSVTEDEREVSKVEKDDKAVPAVQQIDATAKEGEVVEAAIPIRGLTTKRSLWNLIRGASVSVANSSAAAMTRIDVTIIDTSKQEEKVEVPTPQNQNPSSDSAIPNLNKRRSFATFPNLNWSKSSRRHTLTVTNGASEMNETSMALGIERSLDGSIHLPKRNVDEVKVAEDAIRFADARHVIKTEHDIEVIRLLADRLEQGWREKQHEVAVMRHKLEDSQLHLHDIRDENKHLRSQLASMSEQIVARDNDFEQLQRVAVEQSQKERIIWEVEKAQAIHEMEEKVKELQEEVLRFKNSRSRSLMIDGSEDDDDESDYRDAILFSATTSAATSIDDELQYQQGIISVPAPFTTPTTPTCHAART